jgi:hypothetical protein
VLLLSAKESHIRDLIISSESERVKRKKLYSALDGSEHSGIIKGPWRSSNPPWLGTAFSWVRTTSSGGSLDSGRPSGRRRSESLVEGSPREIRSDVMLVVTWNDVQGNKGIGARRLGRLLDAIRSVDPDVVLLQEVENEKATDRLEERLVGRP